jgi:putative secretion ATPase (PEP-CTERM system associated)
MYEHFFRLRAEPFRLSPDHHFCYNHAQYAKAKAYMAYAFVRSEGFVMVTGQPGTGKTTLMGDLIDSLADENVTVGKLVSTQLAPDDLLRMVAFEFGVEGGNAAKSVILQRLTELFRGYKREGRRALLIVDEAQDLIPGALEELRLLTNLQQEGTPLLQIFLLGQPELREMVHRPEMEQVHQRIIAASHMEPLLEDETRAYVEFRLRAVGWDNDPRISSAVFPIIYKFSEGVPRRINLICSRLFLHACIAQEHQITKETARSVVMELQEEQLSTRNLLNDDVFLAEDLFESPLTQEQLVSVTNLRVRGGEAQRREPAPETTVPEPEPSPKAEAEADAVPQKTVERPPDVERADRAAPARQKRRRSVDLQAGSRRRARPAAPKTGSRRRVGLVALLMVVTITLLAGVGFAWRQGLLGFL